MAKKLEIAENEAAMFEMNNKIKFLEIAKKKSILRPIKVTYGPCSLMVLIVRMEQVQVYC